VALAALRNQKKNSAASSYHRAAKQRNQKRGVSRAPWRSELAAIGMEYLSSYRSMQHRRKQHQHGEISAMAARRHGKAQHVSVKTRGHQSWLENRDSAGMAAAAKRRQLSMAAYHGAKRAWQSQIKQR